MNPLMQSGVVPPAGLEYVQDGYGMLQQAKASPYTGDVMACSPYSRGSNSTSPASHHSPGPYAVKAEPLHPGLQMGGPRLQILEQPQERFRFRYESELGGTHGQLAGRSGADRRSFPTVKLEGFNHRATIRCELFTVEEPESNMAPVPHVHTLQGRHCSGGLAEIRVDAECDFIASFQGLGIIHTAKKQMVDRIMNRKLDEKKREIERMSMGKLWNASEDDRREARDQANRESQRINMNRVCLQFRALFQNPSTGLMDDICAPVYSGAIFNGKSAQTGELKIVQLSEAFSPCTGHKEIWLLVERVRKNDIKVLVYEEDSNHQQIWSDYGRVIKCHHQYAIIFQTPPYRDKEIRSPVRVFIQLERPSDGCVSEPKHFQYTERDQRTTKRTLQPAESSGSNDPKRFYFDSEQGRAQFEMPDPNHLRAVLDQRNDMMRQILEQPQLPQLSQQQPVLPQQPLQHLQQQHHQQHQQMRPQHNPPQHSPQMQAVQAGASNYYPQASPLAQPFSPESVTTNSPQQVQMVPDLNYSSPPHPYQSTSQQHMMSPPHSDLGSLAPSASVDDVLSTLQLGGPMPVVTTNSCASMPQPPAYNVYPPEEPPAIANMVTEEQLRALTAFLTHDALEDDSVGIRPPPDRNHRAPRGLVRGLGAADSVPAAADSAPAPAPAPATGGRSGADQLAEAMGNMRLNGDGGGDDGQGGPGGQKKRSMTPNAADTSRPEVQLAYRSADSLYLFAATGDENFLLERYRCLVGMENDDGDNVLHVAAMYQSAKALSYLLEAISGLAEDLRRARVDSHNAKRQTPLHLAVLTGSVECIELLLRAGARIQMVDQEGNTAVHLAAETGNPAVLSVLLDQLTRDGEIGRLLQQTNYKGLSALHAAVLKGRQQAAKMLCEAGADVSAPDDTEGRSPLHLAVQAQDEAMCKLLLRKGAVVDALTFADVTPLHIACKLGDRRLAALLVARGAEPRLQSVERQQTAGSGTESGDEEFEERDAGEEGEQERLDAFLYAEMAGDTMLEQILRGRVQLPIDDDDEQEEGAKANHQPEAVAAPPAAVAAAKKGDMDSGMDSGLGITQELTSACELGSAAEMATAAAGRSSDGSTLPESAVRRLSALLDGERGPWRTVAEFLELDLQTGQRHASPTAYILRCVKKYDNLSLNYLAQVLGTLGLTEAESIVRQYTRT